MTWPSKDPAQYAGRAHRSKRALVTVLLLGCLAGTLVANALAVGDVIVAPALTVALGAVLLLRLHHVRSNASGRRQEPGT